MRNNDHGQPNKFNKKVVSDILMYIIEHGTSAAKEAFVCSSGCIFDIRNGNGGYSYLKGTELQQRALKSRKKYQERLFREFAVDNKTGEELAKEVGCTSSHVSKVKKI